MSLGKALQNVAATVVGNPNLGTSATLRLVTAGTYNPATGATTAPTTTDVPVRGVFQPYRDSSTGLIVQGRHVLDAIPAAGLSRAPVDTDVVVFGGKEYEITGVRPTYAGDVAVTYSLMLRR